MDAYLKDQLDFTGVKVVLFVEKSILVVLRDNKPDIPWPNMWELPGGGREGIETPLECRPPHYSFLKLKKWLFQYVLAALYGC